MATCLFRSPLAFRLQCFLEARKKAGQRGIASQKILIYLDRFLAGELQPGQTITREVADRWIKSLESLSIGTRINRISVLRQFCLYLAHFDPRTCIVHRTFLPRRTRLVPPTYTRKEVRQTRPGRGFTTCVIRLQSTDCWRGIEKAPTSPPNSRWYQRIWGIPPSPAPKFISTPQRSCWRVWGGGSGPTSLFRR